MLTQLIDYANLTRGEELLGAACMRPQVRPQPGNFGGVCLGTTTKKELALTADDLRAEIRSTHHNQESALKENVRDILARIDTRDLRTAVQESDDLLGSLLSRMDAFDGQEENISAMVETGRDSLRSHAASDRPSM